MLQLKEQVPVDKLFFREEYGDNRDYDLWVDRIENHLKWLKDHYWNGFSSWKASYYLDRSIHWAKKGLKGEQIDHATERADQKITIPLIGVHIRNLIPFLAYSEPSFYGRPDKQEAVLDINAQVDYLNYCWREQKMSRQTKKAVLDAAIIGHGICKSGWSERLQDQPSEFDKGKISFLHYDVPNKPWLRRINPFQFIFDRTASDYDIYSARWCCELILKPVGSIIANPDYDEDVVKLIKNKSINLQYYKDFTKEHLEDTDDLFSPELAQEKEQIEIDQLVVLYEVWDRKYKRYYVIPAGQKDYALVDDTWPYEYLNSFPYRTVLFEEIPNDLFGIGHVRYLRDLTFQINRNRSAIFDISNRFSPLYKHRSRDKNIDPNNSEILKTHPPGGVLRLGIDESEDISTLDPPKVSEDTWRISQLIREDWREISGDDILHAGGPLPSRTSAEEIRARRQIRGLRLETSVQNAHEFYLELGNLVLNHARNNIDSEIVVPVIGKPGRHWNTVVKKNFSREFTLDLGIISKPPDPPEVRRRDLMELFQSLANPNLLQLFQQFQIPVPLAYIWRLLLESYEIPELAPLMPDIEEHLVIPSDMQIFNTGFQRKGEGDKTSPASTRMIQSDNVSPESAIQGILNRAG